MSIWSNWFGNTPEQKPYTVKLKFRNSDNNGIVNLTHANVVKSQVWFRVVQDAPECEPVTAIHIFTFADGNQIMYRDDASQRLMEFRSEQ